MSDALNCCDFMDAVRLFLPSESSKAIDRIFVESYCGELYSLTSVIGWDSEIGEEIFVISRSVYSERSLPARGTWREVDRTRTKLRTEYRYRQGDAYTNFQELYDVQFWSGDEKIVVSRTKDDFGLEGLRIDIRKNGE